MERYQLEGEIARGAYGIVHRATDLETGRIVALKTLRMDRPAGVLLDRFRREARLAAGLDHPAVVRVYDAGWDDAQAWFAMELLEGETLEARIARGPMPAAEIRGIGTALARGLAHAHRRGVVHRDIKPSNIVLTSRGPVITDFGLAFSTFVDRLTQTGELVGTPAYMAPEVLRDGARAADWRSDLYSLGAVLYEMATGRPPFDATSFLELSRKVLEEDPAPPLAFAEPVLRCLRKSPGDRFACAEDLARALRDRPRRRRWWVPILTAIALIGALLAAGRFRTEAAPRPRLRVTSEPSGARVELGTTLLGHTPLEVDLPPPGRHKFRLSRAGCLDRSRTVVLEGRAASLHVRLYSAGELPEGMVLVEGPRGPLLVDRCEVTCRDYERFQRVSFREAPLGWRREQPPRGFEDQPVTGVSQEDAAAYARKLGRRLPTLEEWLHLARDPELEGFDNEIREWTATPGRAGGAKEELSPDSRSPILGFRCVMEIEE